MDFDVLLMQYGLLAIFLLIFIKGTGVPIPIPADVILLAVAVGAAQRKFDLWLALVVVLVAMVSGGVIQFWLALGPGRSLLFRFGRYIGLTRARLDAASARVEKGGILGVSVSIQIPGVRSVIIVAAGLAGLRLRTFLPGLVVGSAIFIVSHFILGYLGDSLLALLLSSPILILVVVVLFLAAFALWAIARYRQKIARRERDAEVLGAWHEAVCPACLALSLVSPLRPVASEIEH